MNEKLLKRASGPELLRIIAMIMIIFHHFSVHGKIENYSSFTNTAIVDILSLGGKIGVCIFVIITGYYSINVKNIKMKKIILLLFEAIFYSVITFIISSYFNLFTNISTKNILSLFFPFIINQSGYWFLTTYVLLCFITPFLNIVINSIKKRDLFLLIAFFTVIWSVLEFLVTSKLCNLSSSNLGFFIVEYCIGAYLRKYGCGFINLGKIKRYAFLLLCLMIMIICRVIKLSECYASLPASAAEIIKRILSFFSNSSINSPFVIVIAVLMFLCLFDSKIKMNRLIEILASSTFGIYLFHDSNWIRNILWTRIFDVPSLGENKYLLLYAILYTVIIFSVGTVVDTVRRFCFENLLNKSKLLNKVDNIFFIGEK